MSYRKEMNVSITWTRRKSFGTNICFSDFWVPIVSVDIVKCEHRLEGQEGWHDVEIESFDLLLRRRNRKKLKFVKTHCTSFSYRIGASEASKVVALLVVIKNISIAIPDRIKPQGFWWWRVRLWWIKAIKERRRWHRILLLHACVVSWHRWRRCGSIGHPGAVVEITFQRLQLLLLLKL